MLDSEPLLLSFCTVDLLKRYAHRRDGRTVRLTTKEADLLAFLAARPHEVVSRATLLEQVWEYDARTATRTVDTTVRRLRGKIEADISAPEHIESVHGQGYRFVAPSRPDVDTDGMIGRVLERTEVREQLAAGRVVTLCGLGGMGKTTLARAVAQTWGGPMTFVELADRPHLVDAIAAATGTHGASSATLQAQLNGPRALCVLDNAEHLQEELRDWLTTAQTPEVSWLVTSRIPLGLPNESVLHLEPLSRDDARALFARRCSVAADDLVRALQGIPLAVELAAGMMQVLSPDELLQRGSQWLDLLSDGSGSRAPSQSSVRASLDVSWSLLDASERDLWCLLGCLRGPADLELVEALVGGEVETVLALQRLQQAGLVRRDARGRWDMLDLVRAYGRARATAVHTTRHAQTVGRVGRRLAEAFEGSEPSVALRSLLAIREDLEHVLTGPPSRWVGDAIVSMTALWAVTGVRGAVDRRDLIDAALPSIEPRSRLPVRLSRLLLGAMRSLVGPDSQEVLREARTLVSDAADAGEIDTEVMASARLVELSATLGCLDADVVDALLDRAGSARPQVHSLALTVVADRAGRTDAERLLRQAARVARRGGATRAALSAQQRLAVLLDHQGRLDEAEEESPDLAALTACGGHRDVARELLRRASVYRHLGQHDDAIEFATEVTTDPTLGGRPHIVASAHLVRAYALVETDRLHEAVADTRQALRWAESSGAATAEITMHILSILLRLVAGNIDAALAHADAAERLLTPLRSQVGRVLAGPIALARVLAGSGAPAAAVPLHRRSLVEPVMANVLASVLTGDPTAEETIASLRVARVMQAPQPLADLQTIDEIRRGLRPSVAVGTIGMIARRWAPARP